MRDVPKNAPPHHLESKWRGSDVDVDGDAGAGAVAGAAADDGACHLDDDVDRDTVRSSGCAEMCCFYRCRCRSRSSMVPCLLLVDSVVA